MTAQVPGPGLRRPVSSGRPDHANGARTRPRRGPRTGDGGTPTPTPTTPSTASSWATPTWSGARKTCANPTPTCWVTSAGGGFSRSAAGRRPAPGTWPGRARPWWPSTCQPACWRMPRRPPDAPGRRFRLCRPTSARCPSPTEVSTWPSRPSARFRSSPTRRARCARWPRVLRPGGRWVFAATHPMRWAFPDDPGPAGLTAIQSYFDRSPYVEVDAHGVPAYVEHHRTMGDRIREIVAAGFVAAGRDRAGMAGRTSPAPGGSGRPERGEIFPGTAIFVAQLPG